MSNLNDTSDTELKFLSNQVAQVLAIQEAGRRHMSLDNAIGLSFDKQPFRLIYGFSLSNKE